MKKGAKVGYVLSFYPRGSKLSLFSLYGQPLARYESIVITSIFGHEICNFKAGPNVAYVLPLYPPAGGGGGGQIKLIFALRAAVFEIEQF